MYFMNLKAIRSTIQIAEIELEVFRLPDSSYALSQTQVAEAVGKTEASIRRFYVSKAGKALLDKGYITVDLAANVKTGFIKAVSLHLARGYWRKEDKAENLLASAIVEALMAESLETKCAIAFQSIKVVELEPGTKAKIEREAIAAYRATLFGGLSNGEYVELATECRIQHQALNR
jgi:hypothetical protein